MDLQIQACTFRLTQAESFFGTDQCDMIIVQLKSSDNATITNVSKAITDHFGGQVSVISSTAVLSLLSTVFSTIQLFLGGIAAISLLVAGIGNNEHNDSVVD